MERCRPSVGPGEVAAMGLAGGAVGLFGGGLLRTLEDSYCRNGYRYDTGFQGRGGDIHVVRGVLLEAKRGRL